MPTDRELVFIVNRASGGGAGRRLLAALRRRLGEDRVLDIARVDLAALARSWSGRDAALVACGGDGTVAAVAEAAHAAGERGPAAAVVPLGTGNDLARSLGWPANGPDESGLDALISSLARAPAVPIDRWLLSGPGGAWPWFNYCSWGYDARVAGRFHRTRRLHGRVLRWRVTNLACYLGSGLQEAGGALGLDIVAGGRVVAVPAWTRALVLASISSYAGGCRLGNRIAADDGCFDGFAFGAGLAYGIGLSGWRRPRGIGTFAGIEVRLRRRLFLQLDGEPRLAAPGRWRVEHAGQVRILARSP